MTSSFLVLLWPFWCLDGARYVYRTVKDIRFPLSVRNERAAMQRLLALVKEIISGYPTTLEEDKEQLKVRKQYVCNGIVEPLEKASPLQFTLSR